MNEAKRREQGNAQPRKETLSLVPRGLDGHSLCSASETQKQRREVSLAKGGSRQLLRETETAPTPPTNRLPNPEHLKALEATFPASLQYNPNGNIRPLSHFFTYYHDVSPPQVSEAIKREELDF